MTLVGKFNCMKYYSMKKGGKNKVHMKILRSDEAFFKLAAALKHQNCVYNL